MIRTIKKLLLHEFRAAKPTFVKNCPHRVIANDDTLAGLFETMLRDCIEIANEYNDINVIAKKIHRRVIEYILLDKSYVRNTITSETVLCNIIYSTTYKELYDLLKMKLRH